MAAISKPPQAGILKWNILLIKSEMPAELGNAHRANAVIKAPAKR